MRPPNWSRRRAEDHAALEHVGVFALSGARRVGRPAGEVEQLAQLAGEASARGELGASACCQRAMNDSGVI